MSFHALKKQIHASGTEIKNHLRLFKHNVIMKYKIGILNNAIYATSKTHLMCLTTYVLKFKVFSLMASMHRINIICLKIQYSHFL